jgi:hypothetical protein
MHFRTLAIALAVFGLVAASPVLAKSPHRYTLHGKHCKRGYRKARRPHKTFCIKRPAKKGAALAEKVKLHAHLDPSYTRNPLDPFEVTYAYSASATQEPLGRSASISAEEPASLPSGVLAFYSDGRLECAVNVGGSAVGSECPVEYQALGEHRVTTIYSSGEQSATETEVESIQPLPTSTGLDLSYEARVPLATTGGLWWIGDLKLNTTASPTGLAVSIGCGGGAPNHLTTSGCYEINNSHQHVYANPTGSCSAPELGAIYIAESPSTTGSALMPEDVELGAYHARASVAGVDGYMPSEAITPIQFTPEVTFAPAC